MTAVCAGFGDSQVKPSCESSWLLLVLGLGLSCCLFDRSYEVVKHEPRPVIHKEKQLGWSHKLGGVESLGISRVGQTVGQGDGVSNMAPACQLQDSFGERT